MRNKNLLQIAYKNEIKTGIVGWLICKIKRWNIWHEEIIFPTVHGKPWSNKISVADNPKGVTSREGRYSHPDRWEFIDVYEIGGRKVTIELLDEKWIEHLSHVGEKYSFKDIIFNLILPTKWNNKKEWFCDEWSRHFREKTPEAVGAPRSKKEAIEDNIKYLAEHANNKYCLE